MQVKKEVGNSNRNLPLQRIVVCFVKGTICIRHCSSGELRLHSTERAPVLLQRVEAFINFDRQRQSCLFIVGLELNLSCPVNGPFVITSRC
jgi:hypothetical protein